MVFIALSAVLAWFFTSPINFYFSFEDTRLALNFVDTEFNNGLEVFTTDNCEKAANCECVALIHGLGDTAYTWSKTLRASAKDWDVPFYFYAVNLPGSSESKALEDASQYNVNALADRIATSLPDRCEKWTLVGNSFGGWISTKLASRHPDKVKALLLLGSAGINTDYSEIIPLFAEPTADRLKVLIQRAYAEEKIVPGFILRDLATRLKSMPVATMIGAQSKDDFIDEDLKNLKIPIALVWGEKDLVCPVDYAYKMQKLNPKARLEVIKDCGHLPQKECFKDFARNLNILVRDSVVSNDQKLDGEPSVEHEDPPQLQQIADRLGLIGLFDRLDLEKNAYVH